MFILMALSLISFSGSSYEDFSASGYDFDCIPKHEYSNYRCTTDMECAEIDYMLAEKHGCIDIMHNNNESFEHD